MFPDERVRSIFKTPESADTTSLQSLFYMITKESFLDFLGFLVGESSGLLFCFVFFKTGLYPLCVFISGDWETRSGNSCLFS